MAASARLAKALDDLVVPHAIPNPVDLTLAEQDLREEGQAHVL